MTADAYTRPERAAEIRLAKRHRARIAKLGLCSACVHRGETFGIYHCRLWHDRRHPQCDKDGKGITFTFDPETLEPLRDKAA